MARPPDDTEEPSAPEISPIEASEEFIERVEAMLRPIRERQAGTMARVPVQQAAVSRTALLKTAPRFRLESFDDITFDEEPHLVEDLIPTSGVGTIFGASASYKSFVCLNLSFQIAVGRAWAGKATKRSDVVYIAPEGANGMRKRIVGLKHQFPGVDAPLHLLGATVNLGTDGADLTQIIKLIEVAGIKPGFIVIDTLSASLAAGDENGPGMTQFIANCQRLAERFKAFVLAVHHIGHGDEKRERGHSSLIGNVDVRIRAERLEKMKVRLTVLKTKDDEDGADFNVALRKVEVGKTISGKLLTTLVVDAVTLEATAEGEAPAQNGKPLSKAALIRHAIADAYSSLSADVRATPGLNGASVYKVKVDELRNWLKRHGHLQTDDNGKIAHRDSEAFSSVKKRLLHDKTFVEEDGLIWKIAADRSR